MFLFYLTAAERPQHCALVGLSALAVEAYGFTLVRACVRACVCARVRACVRPSHHIWKTSHQIFLKLCTKYIDESKKMFQVDF